MSSGFTVKLTHPTLRAFTESQSAETLLQPTDETSTAETEETPPAAAVPAAFSSGMMIRQTNSHADHF